MKFSVTEDTLLNIIASKEYHIVYTNVLGTSISYMMCVYWSDTTHFGGIFKCVDGKNGRLID